MKTGQSWAAVRGCLTEEGQQAARFEKHERDYCPGERNV